MASAELLTDASRAVDANGSPYANAKWRFYASGTLTPLNVYANAALSSSLGSVVTADAGGRFVPIYFDASKSYRGRLEDSLGNLLPGMDIDPLNSSIIASLSGSGDNEGADVVGFDIRSLAPKNTVAWGFKRTISRSLAFYDADPAATNAQNSASVAEALGEANEIGVPAGVYLLNGNAMAGMQGKTLIGEGDAFSTQLKMTASGDLFSLTGSSNIVFRNLTMFADPSLVGARGIAINSASNVKIYNCLLYNFYKAAVQMTGVIGQQISGCIIKDNLFFSNAHDGSSAQLEAAYSNDFHYCGNQFGSFVPVVNRPNIGVRMTNCSNGVWRDDFIWEATTGILTDNCKWSLYDGVRVEQSQREGWVATAGYQNRYVNLRLNDNSEQTVNGFRNMVWNSETYSDIIGCTSEAWDAPTQQHSISFAFENYSQFNTVMGLKSKDCGTNHVTLDATSTGNEFLGSQAFTSNIGITGGTTTYLGPAGNSSSAASAYKSNGRSVAIAIDLLLTVAPGAGQSVTATLMRNGVPITALQCVISDAATSAMGVGTVNINAGDYFSIRLQYSAGAATSVPMANLTRATI